MVSRMLGLPQHISVQKKVMNSFDQRHSYQPGAKQKTQLTCSSQLVYLRLVPSLSGWQELFVLHLSNPIPGAPGGAAGRGQARLSANGIVCPDNKSPASLPRHRGNIVSTSFQRQEQADFFKIERGLSAVYHRDEMRALFAAADK